MEARVEKLQKDWNKKIPAETIAAMTDKSVPNLSSIVLMAEAGGKKILMTGDARGDDVLEGLEIAGYKIDGSMVIDVLKVPHHGSNRNVDLAFFQAVPARTYVISAAGGKHKNPDPDVLDWICEARGEEEFEIVMASNLLPAAKHKAVVKQMEKLQNDYNFTFRFRDDDELSVMVEL